MNKYEAIIYWSEDDDVLLPRRQNSQDAPHTVLGDPIPEPKGRRWTLA